MRGKVDIVATVTGGGYSGQSGAIRLGIATGLSCFVDEQMVEDMRMGKLIDDANLCRYIKFFIFGLFSLYS